MKSYIKLYHEFFGLTFGEFIECTVCRKKAIHFHHINFKGMGGSKYADRIDNLIALCYDCHIQAHNHILTKEQLTELQRQKIDGNI